MKLKYDLELMEIGEEFVAVDAKTGTERFQGMIRMNQEGAEMLRAVQGSASPEEALDRLCRQYPDIEREELGQELCDFLNRLLKEGILEP